MNAAPRDADRLDAAANAAVDAEAAVRGRLLVHPPAEAAWNMAVDQALLESAAAGGAPVLRFYRWQQPTLSLGYFQQADDRRRHPDSAGLTVVRRATGGGAIVHDHEVTYSLAMPLPDRGRRTVAVLYDVVHQAIRQSLAELGIAATRFADTGRPAVADPPPFLCFQRRTADDLIVAGYKVVGSAQRRAAGAVLQHGSILLRVSRFAPELPGIVDLTGRACQADPLQQRLADTIPALRGHAVQRARWERCTLTAEERRRAETVAQEKFAEPNWTFRR